jgi:hypothetical protein
MFASKNKLTFKIRLWDPETGKAQGDALRGHGKWITALAWEPLHLYILIEIELMIDCRDEKIVD